MTLFQMAAAISGCDAAMILEGVDAATRERVLQRFSKTMATVMIEPPKPITRLPEVPHGRPS